MTWLAASFGILGVALVAGFAWYERSHPTARVLALIATLAALAALGRVAFAPLPNVKPTTDIVLLTGYVLGGAPGFAVGAVAALASNVFFGQGPWTPWQMVGWGGVGLLGAGLARLAGRELGRVGLASACFVAGLGFGAVMNLSLWVTFSGDHSLEKLGFFFATSLPFDLAHAIGNALFCLAFGPALVRMLQRYRMRFEVTWRPALGAGGAAAVLLALVMAAGLALPPQAPAQVPRASVAYLERAQNADGGFGGAPGQRSTQLYTGWAALGLAAAGRNPLDVSRRSSIAAYVRANARELSDLGELERTIMVAGAAGVSPQRLSGRDLVGELVRKRGRDGSFAGRVNTTSFAVLALRSAGRSTGDRTVRAAGGWITGQANRDGGYNFGGRGGPSGIDDTGAALQALVAAGRRRSRVVRRAASFLVTRQNADGGYPLVPGGGSNAQSTAWAIQGLLAAGRDPARVRRGGSRTPVDYLRTLVTGSGAVRYSRTSAQTPVWVTAQALAALAGRPFPLGAVPRARRAAAPRASAAPAPRRRAPRFVPAAPEPTARPSAPASPAPAPAAPEPQPVAAPRTGPPTAAALPARARAAGELVALLAGATR